MDNSGSRDQGDWVKPARYVLVFANAGVTSFEPFEKMTSQDIAWIIEVNLMGVVHCVEVFLPHMLAQKDGHIVATSSTAGLIPSCSRWSISEIPPST